MYEKPNFTFPILYISQLIITFADMEKTEKQFKKIMAMCRALYAEKLKDYGAAWRILRPCSVTDQIYIKASRIRSISTKGEALVDEGIKPEFIAIVNYGIMALIQVELGYADTDDLTCEQALELYDKYSKASLDLMIRKNHDYGEAWRGMRVSSFTDIILQKIYRTKQIEDNCGETRCSEGVDANYKDMINYAVFALIKLEYGE